MTGPVFECRRRVRSPPSPGPAPGLLALSIAPSVIAVRVDTRPLRACRRSRCPRFRDRHANHDGDGDLDMRPVSSYPRILALPSSIFPYPASLRGYLHPSDEIHLGASQNSNAGSSSSALERPPPSFDHRGVTVTAGSAVSCFVTIPRMTLLGLPIVSNKGTSGRMDTEGSRNYDRSFEPWILCSKLLLSRWCVRFGLPQTQ